MALQDGTEFEYDDAPDLGGIAVGGFVVDDSLLEDDPPVGTPVSPDVNETPGSSGAFSDAYATAKDTAIVYTVVDVQSAIAFVSISVKFSDRTHTEEVYSGRPILDGLAGFVTPYVTFSGLSGSGAAGVGVTFSIRRDDGWPAQTANVTTLELRIRAIDALGNLLIDV